MTTRTVFAKRPANVDPDWWARATWRARELAVANARRATAADERRRNEQALREATLLEQQIVAGDKKAPRVPYQKRTEQVLELLAHGSTYIEVVLHLGATPGSIDVALRRGGHPDLALQFGRLRSTARQKDPCPDCGQPKRNTAKQCLRCSRAARRNTPTDSAQPGQDHRKDAA